MFKLPALPWTFAEAKLVNGHLFAPSERQFVEGERILRTGSPVILIGWKKGQMYLSPWVKQGDVRTSYSDPERSEVNALREYLTWRQQEKLDDGFSIGGAAPRHQ